jgi:hypothetical protein
MHEKALPAAEVESFHKDIGPFDVAAEQLEWRWCLQTLAKPDHPIIFANDSFLSLTGYARDERWSALQRAVFHAPEYVTMRAAIARTQLKSSTRRTGLPKRPPLASTAVSTTCFPSLCIEISYERPTARPLTSS